MIPVRFMGHVEYIEGTHERVSVWRVSSWDRPIAVRVPEAWIAVGKRVN